MPVSQALARNAMKWCHWMVPRLGIKQGRFSLKFHDGQLARVKLVYTASFPAAKRGEFDGVESRRQFDEAVRILNESNGNLSPTVAVWCIYTIFAVLYRISDYKFGTMGVTVRDSKVDELKSKKTVRPDAVTAADQFSGTAFLPHDRG